MAEDFIEGGISKPDWIRDPDTDELLPIERDHTWLDAMRAFHASECRHEQLEPRKVKIADGRPQVYRCCVQCGERSGTAMSQKDRQWVEGLEWLADDLVENYRSRRSRQKHGILGPRILDSLELSISADWKSTAR